MSELFTLVNLEAEHLECSGDYFSKLGTEILGF
jgi:hypothetical protein